MQFADLPYIERNRLYNLYTSGADLYPVSVERGWKLASLERRLREFGARQVTESPKPKLDKPPTIGDCLILADPHIPYHDATFINRCIDVALSMGIKECCVAGDLLDYNAFSPFDPNVSDTLEAEYAAAEDFLGVLAGAFQSVLRIKGNHDARLDKRIGYHQLSADRARRILTDKPNVVFSDYYHCLCNGWRICHPKNASVVPGSVAAKLAGKYSCNVVAGHGHVFGVAQDISAQYIGIDSGACADPARIEYVEMRMNTRPRIYQGAVVLKDGMPTLINKAFDVRLK